MIPDFFHNLHHNLHHHHLQLGSLGSSPADGLIAFLVSGPPISEPPRYSFTSLLCFLLHTTARLCA